MESLSFAEITELRSTCRRISEFKDNHQKTFNVNNAWVDLGVVQGDRALLFSMKFCNFFYEGFSVVYSLQVSSRSSPRPRRFLNFLGPRVMFVNFQFLLECC